MTTSSSFNGNAPEDGPRRRLPNYVQIADAYTFQQTIDERLRRVGVTEQREVNLRLAGVKWIDDVRQNLKLPVKTFATAVMYYHKFRLVHSDGEYAYTDASAAALFAACKIEDTLKKSKDILCGAHNLKAPKAEQTSPDDPIFETPSRTVIGLERLMLEASSFDFRARHPQPILLKLLKTASYASSSPVSRTAYKHSLDLYRSFCPLKQTTATMALACVELSERIHDVVLNEEMMKQRELVTSRMGVSRGEVMETMMDLLDLYIQYNRMTVLGSGVVMERFLNVRIPLNDEMERKRLPRYTQWDERRGRDGVGDSPNGYPQHGAGQGRVTNGTGSGRSSKNVSPKDAMTSPSTNGSGMPGSGSTGVTSVASVNTGVAGSRPGVRQPIGQRGREGTVRFMLNPDRERGERMVVADYSREDREGLGAGGGGG